MNISETVRINPTIDHVLIRRAEPQERTRGGIIIPENVRGEDQQVHEGDVVGVGPGRITDDGKRIEPCVKMGDRVLFNRYSSALLLKHGDTELVMVRESSLIAVLDR